MEFWNYLVWNLSFIYSYELSGVILNLIFVQPASLYQEKDQRKKYVTILIIIVTYFSKLWGIQCSNQEKIRELLQVMGPVIDCTMFAPQILPKDIQPTFIHPMLQYINPLFCTFALLNIALVIQCTSLCFYLHLHSHTIYIFYKSFLLFRVWQNVGLKDLWVICQKQKQKIYKFCI